MDTKFKDIPVILHNHNKQKRIGKAYYSKDGQFSIKFLDGWEINYSIIRNSISINFEVTEYVKNEQNLFSSVKSLKVKEITFSLKG